MPKFDFITDDKFRASLESDYAELDACMLAKSWKAVHVLSGSIVEALLVDYLLATDHQKKAKADPLKMQLADAIKACKDEGVLSDRASDLSSVIRGYRNLIHPGRVIRLQEKVDDKTAAIAKALVDIVIDEVIAGKKESYGYTAEQIIAKIQKDPSSIPILRHLLREAREIERKRLLMQIIPDHYLGAADDEMFYPKVQVEQAFRIIYNSVPDEIKKEVAKRFVKIIKEESEEYVTAYGTAFSPPNTLDTSPRLIRGSLRRTFGHVLITLKRSSSKSYVESVVSWAIMMLTPSHHDCFIGCSTLASTRFRKKLPSS